MPAAPSFDRGTVLESITDSLRRIADASAEMKHMIRLSREAIDASRELLRKP